MGIIKNTYHRIQNLIYYVVIAGLALVGLFMLQMSITEFGDEDIGLSIFMVVVSFIPLGFPVLVVRDKLRDRKLMRWLVEHVEELGEGVEGPGGVVYSFDTELVRYEGQFTMVVISTNLISGFYSRGSNNLLPKTLYTLFTLIFGWWMVDPQVWLGNLVTISENLGDSNVVTVGELFFPELDEAENAELENVETGEGDAGEDIV